MTAADALRRLLADVRAARFSRLEPTVFETVGKEGLSRCWSETLDYLERVALDGLAGEAEPNTAKGDDGYFFCPKCDAFTE